VGQSRDIFFLDFSQPQGYLLTIMTYRHVMSQLESMGTAQNRKIYKRHGADENMFGVSFANLNKLKKQIKTNHDLALELWATENTDARALATMIANPAEMTKETAEDWLRDITYYALVDVYVQNVVSRTRFWREKMESWMRSKNEWTGRAGWQLLALMAMKDVVLPDGYFERCLEVIERDIHGAKNRTREAMNSALIAIGIKNDSLAKTAIEAAERIGTVEVDHGETACKTPEATSYINRTRARKREMESKKSRQKV
jgi:3-methyladenine DNA glycosylase AlkD